MRAAAERPSRAEVTVGIRAPSASAAPTRFGEVGPSPAPGTSPPSQVAGALPRLKAPMFMAEARVGAFAVWSSTLPQPSAGRCPQQRRYGGETERADERESDRRRHLAEGRGSSEG
ncbi:hypothetical protein ITI46_23995 [Streptomyces oryzae]|uniref:Uncharacterized protein n=1 Tax=Streptomyces oryzae TaxID=1434886 RepID=A0ABS3XHC4_9ACTN|nr:hypothetical protein [Streptomyces oryzae]